MRPAFLALAGAATLSTAFAVVETAAFVTMLAVPVVVATVSDARAAGTLYRWTEPDGSLTYSPTAPTDGTPYDEVDPMTMGRPALPASDTGRASAPLTRSATAPSRTAPTFDGSRSIVRADGVSATTPSLGAAARRQTPAASTARSSNTARTVVSNDKERRCDELAKRVVSLERRLATPLSPDAMDDTVVQMARYQQSVERHCR